MKLVQEIVLQPRWDIKEFDLIKQSTLSKILQQKANPNNIADNEFKKLVYGEESILSNNNIGTENSVKNITIEDLKNYYTKNISPSVSNFQIVGAISESDVNSSLNSLNKEWKPKDVVIPKIESTKGVAKSKIYFYDVPDAKQSVIRIGYLALAATDKDFYPAKVMNYRLGGGGFASELTQQLREGKGYTYGIRSSFQGSNNKGPFTIDTGVRSNVTYESISLTKEITEQYGKKFGKSDLDVSKDFLIKSNARAYETLSAKLNMLYEIGNYNFSNDYAKQRENIVKAMTIEEIQKLADKYLNVNEMIYVIAGDAKTQLQKLEQIGFGAPVLLNPSTEMTKN